MTRGEIKAEMETKKKKDVPLSQQLRSSKIRFNDGRAKLFVPGGLIVEPEYPLKRRGYGFFGRNQTLLYGALGIGAKHLVLAVPVST